MKYNALMVLVLFPLALNAQLSPGNHEFLVNTYAAGDQREPAAAGDGKGTTVVVWTSLGQDGGEEGIFAQRWNGSDGKLGTEFRVNTTTAKTQYRPSVDMNSSGRFVVVWASMGDVRSGFDIYAQMFDSTGAKDGPEILVNTTTANSQNYPAVAVDGSGNFCVVWHSWGQDGGDRGVYGQRFTAAGAKAGPEFRVNTATAFSQARPSIDMTPDGRFVVVWESWNQDSSVPSGYGVYGRRFAADGTPQGTEFQVNTYTNNYQWLGNVAVAGDGSFIVVWCSWREDGFDGGVYGQRYDADGYKRGGEFLINSTAVNYQWLPRVAIDADSSFTVVWSSWKQDGNREGVFGQMFDKEGNKKSLEFRVNEYTDSYQWEPVILPSVNHQFLVVWSSWNQNGAGEYDVFARRISPAILAGVIKSASVSHPAGLSNAGFSIYVMDSTQLTGDTYRITFTQPAADTTVAVINNVSKNRVAVDNFRIDKGAGYVYQTNVFDGITVQFKPFFGLSLDVNRSYVTNHSGSNVQLTVTDPATGKKETAPIDLVLIFGNTDTANGTYVHPLDTALSKAGKKTILVPFKAWNTQTGAELELLVMEPTATTNARWDLGEPIIVLTPPPYNSGASSTHVQFNTVAPVGVPAQLPAAGDSVVVFTRRPFTAGDIFEFTTQKSNFTTSAGREQIIPGLFELYRNYPNPFNPSTTIRYTLAVHSIVRLDVFNALGQHVATLVNGPRPAGDHRVLFNGKSLASGIYFYRLRIGDAMSVRTMVLVK